MIRQATKEQLPQNQNVNINKELPTLQRKKKKILLD